MKKSLMITILMIAFVSMGFAQKQAEIKFDKTTQDLGTFSESNAVQQAVFTFTNVGNSQLWLHRSFLYKSSYPTWTKGTDKSHL